MGKLEALVAFGLLVAGAAAQAPVDVNTTGACKVAIATYCEGVAPGNGRVLACLMKATARQQAKLGPVCGRETARLIILATETGVMARTVLNSTACKPAVTQFCLDRSSTLGRWGCLKAVPKKSITEACKAKILETEKLEADFIEFDFRFFRACSYDMDVIEECRFPPMAKVLASGETPVSGRKACLMRHRKDLTGACSDALFTRLRHDLRDIRLMPAVQRACKEEIKDFCGRLQMGEGRVMKCLNSNSGKPQFSQRCKDEVLLVTTTKLSAYRLHYNIRKHCEKDITSICAEEKRRVDAMSAAEIFGTNTTKGKGGLVLHCLKANYTKVRAKACKSALKRMVQSHAKNPSTDPVFRRTCKADIATYCSNTDHDRLHFCLRNNLKKISKPCRDVEIAQGSIAAMDISLKPRMKSACSQAIKKLCGDVDQGDAQIIQCLQDQLGNEEMGGSCFEAVMTDLEASNHDWRLKFGVHQHCLMDASRLCAAEVPKAAGAVLNCLKHNYTQLANRACKAEIFRHIQQGANNIRLAPNTHAACVQDVAFFCKDVHPGQGQVHACLASHSLDISRPCAQAEFEEQRLVAQDIRFHPKAWVLCRRAMRDLCADVPPGQGKRWDCLSQHKASEKIPPACKRIVSAHETLQNYEFHLNPALATHCSKEAGTLCPFEASMSDLKEFGSEGQTIMCLIERRSLVKNSACKEVLLRKAIQRLANFDANPESREFCEEDARRLCPNMNKASGEGQVHRCLWKHINNLTTGCRMVQRDLVTLRNQDSRLMGFMKKECAAAADRYCKNVLAGEGQKVMCMLKKTHAEDMEPECRKKLESLQQLRAKSIQFNPLLAKACQQDLELLQVQFQDDIQCRKQPSQEVALVGSSIRCLLRHPKQIVKADCKQAIRNIQQLEADDLRAVPGMQKACEKDLEVLCSHVEAGGGRWHECLQSRKKRIASPECRAMVARVSKAQSNDVILNPAVRRTCTNEIRNFCQGTARGQGRIFNCLVQSRGKEGFGEPCKQSLDAMGKNLTVAAADPKFQRDTRSFWDKWGMVLIGVIAFLLAVWAVLMCYLIRWLRKGRSLYGVHVDTAVDEGNRG